MKLLRDLLLLSAAACFLLAAIEVKAPRVDLIAAGLLLVTISVLVG